MPNHNFLKQTKNPLALILFPSKATLTFIFQKPSDSYKYRNHTYILLGKVKINQQQNLLITLILKDQDKTEARKRGLIQKVLAHVSQKVLKKFNQFASQLVQNLNSSRKNIFMTLSKMILRNFNDIIEKIFSTTIIVQI